MREIETIAPGHRASSSLPGPTTMSGASAAPTRRGPPSFCRRAAEKASHADLEHLEDVQALALPSTKEREIDQCPGAPLS